MASRTRLSFGPPRGMASAKARLGSKTNMAATKTLLIKLILQSVGADGIFEDGEAEGIGPDLIDGATGFGAELEEKRGGEEPGLGAVDGGQPLAQAHGGAVGSDPVDAEDFHVEPGVGAIDGRRVILVGAVPDLAQPALGGPVRAAQNAADAQIVVELVIDLPVGHIAEDFCLDDRLVRGHRSRAHRGLGECKAGGGIIGDNDGGRIDIEDRDSCRAQTADDAEDKAHQAKALPKPFTAQRAIDQLFLDDFLFTRHPSCPHDQSARRSGRVKSMNRCSSAMVAASITPPVPSPTVCTASSCHMATSAMASSAVTRVLRSMLSFSSSMSSMSPTRRSTRSSDCPASS